MQLKIVLHKRRVAQEAVDRPRRQGIQYAALAMTPIAEPSSPAQARDPVRRGLSVQSQLPLEYWIVRHAQLRTRRTMTTEYEFAISRRIAPELCIIVCPPRKERAQGRPGARCTRGLVCNCAQGKRTRAYRYRRSIPAFPAQWLYGLLRALPGERLFCLRRPREASLLRLNASTATSEPHDFAVRSGAYVCRAISVHRIPPRVRDVRERPSHRVRRAELCG